jgi:hypothetical protein
VIGLYLARFLGRAFAFVAVGLFFAFLAYVAAAAQNTNQTAADLIVTIFALCAAFVVVTGVLISLRRPKHWQGLTRDEFRRQHELISTGKRLRRQRDASDVDSQSSGVPLNHVVVTQVDEVYQIGVVDHVTWQNILRDFWCFVRGRTPNEALMSFSYCRTGDHADITRPRDQFFIFSWFGGASVRQGGGEATPATAENYDWLAAQLQSFLDPPGL